MLSIFSRLFECTDPPLRLPTGEPARLIEPRNWLMRLKVRLVDGDDNVGLVGDHVMERRQRVAPLTQHRVVDQALLTADVAAIEGYGM